MTALLTDNLPLLAGAPNGIKKLRELILELAVRGKLVPQDPSDEPASELLKRIAEEKARLMAEGAIKKQKALPEIAEEEIPFELPAGWEWARFGSVLDFQGGGQPPKDYFSDTPQPGYVQLIQIRDLGERPQPVFIPRELASKFCTSDDIMVGRYGASVGKTFWGKEGSYNVALVKMVDEHNIFYKGFLYQLLKSPLGQSYFLGISRSAQDGFNKSDIEQKLVPISPLAEQHRIVAKIDELMALCDRLEARQADADSAHAQLVQALLESLTQARDAGDFAQSWQRLAENFHTLFTTESSIDALKQTLLQLAVMGKLVPQDPSDEPACELVGRIQFEKHRFLAESKARKQKDLDADLLPEPPFDAPDGWEWQCIDDVLHVTGGVTLGRKLANRKLVSKPYLRVANVQRGKLELDQIKEVEVPEDEVEKYLLRNGDLLITEGGDWDKVGRTAIWREELSECLHQNHVFRARAIVEDWEPRWAEMYLNSIPARDYFAGSAKQTTNLASINMTQLRACAFPLPPLAEQLRIVARVDQLMAICDQLKARLNQARQVHEQLADALVEQAVA